MTEDDTLASDLREYGVDIDALIDALATAMDAREEGRQKLSSSYPLQYLFLEWCWMEEVGTELPEYCKCISHALRDIGRYSDNQACRRMLANIAEGPYSVSHWVDQCNRWFLVSRENRNAAVAAATCSVVANLVAAGQVSGKRVIVPTEIDDHFGGFVTQLVGDDLAIYLACGLSSVKTLSALEAAECLGYTQEHVTRLARSGRIKARRCFDRNGSWRCNAASVAAYYLERKQL